MRTTGIIEQTFRTTSKVIYKIYDIGGQRHERRKWVHCFQNVTCIIFVAALIGYDQTLFEDGATNRMVEAMQLFDEIVNSKWFKTIPIILFLNKKDLFGASFFHFSWFF